MDLEVIVSMAQVALPPDRVPTEEEIRATVERLAIAFGLDDDAKSLVVRKLLARSLVRMETGFALVKDHVPWVAARRPDIDPYYWDRFKRWLQKERWPAGVLTGLDRTTDEVLDLLGNPAEPGTWKRRGLVMGNVQSGKTATYSALICKAADAGYRFVILLTGTIENLRRQTQERLDAGFVGFDSSELLKRNRRDLRVGVGLIDGRRHSTVFTSSASDFRGTTVDALGLSLDALREPALVVIKKHLKILQNLRDWLRLRNPGAGPIDIPMLLIDDEADNASINTNDENQDPTKVNAGIRELLTLFRQTTYVGFTATPFANIFVNPDSKEDMLGDDLFPRDFIYSLQAPTNYFGPRAVFLEDAGAALHLRTIDDLEDAIPTRHKSDLTVPYLPPSMIEALRAFLVTNAIRDLRGEGATHRSMLVNISQFTKVQDQVEGLLHAELERIQTDIRNFAGLPETTALANASLAGLHAVWQAEYADAGFTWAEVQASLQKSALPVTTKAVNQRTGARALDYKAYKDTGLRVVAVGGNSLSRGLTLEGLAVSYFRRNTKMYDTLLQMGRWFGYRPGYQDVCRVWLHQEAVDWYGHIAEASEELQEELRRMYRLRRTPNDFGLAVRAHPDSLMVTARNKARQKFAVDQYLPVGPSQAGQHVITRPVSISGRLFESVELPLARTPLKDNFDAVVALMRTICPGQLPPDARFAGAPFFRNVPVASVATLLAAFEVPEADLTFQPKALADLLGSVPEAGDPLSFWDVIFPVGRGAPTFVADVEMKASERSVLLTQAPPTAVVSGTKRRVGSRGIERAGLDEEALARAVKRAAEEEIRLAAEEGRKPREGKSLNVADRFYREERTKPLLLVHVLDPKPAEPVPASWASTIEGRTLVAVGVSFPVLADDRGYVQRFAKYKINLTKVRELYGNTEEVGDDEEVVEEEP